MSNSSHVPGGSEFEEGSYHYRRDERLQLPNSPVHNKKRRNLRFVILAFDLALIAGVAMCLRSSGVINIFGSGSNTAPGEFRHSVIHEEYSYTLVAEYDDEEKIELRLVKQHTNARPFPYETESRVVFSLTAPEERRILPAQKPALQHTSPLFVYYADTTVISNAVISAAYFAHAEQDEPLITVTLPVE